MLIPLLFILEKIIPFTPLDILSSFKIIMHIKEGILSVQSRDNPRIVEERLNAICTGNLELDYLTAKFVDFSENARREGILVLEDNINEIDDPMLCAGLKMVLYGRHPVLVKTIMEILSEIIFKYNNLYYYHLENYANLSVLRIILAQLPPLIIAPTNPPPGLDQAEANNRFFIGDLLSIRLIVACFTV